MKSKILLISIYALIFNSCYDNRSRINKFSPEEIESLQLYDTEYLIVDNKNVKTFDISPFLKKQNFFLGDKIKSIKYLPLETTRKSLISEIEQIVVTEEHIYIRNGHTENNVLIFDKFGKYLNQINRGQGPGEILQLKGIAFDSANQELIVYHSYFLSYFTKDGQFNRKDKLPFNAHYFTIIPDGYLFYAVNGVDNTHLGYPKNNQILVTDKFFKLKRVGFPYNMSENFSYGGKGFRVNNERVDITFTFTDTIYQFVNTDMAKAKYSFDLGNKAISRRVLFSDIQQSDFESLIQSNDLYYFLGKYEETDNHIYIGYYNSYHGLRCELFIDKKSEEVIGGTSIVYYAEMFPYLGSPISAIGDYFIAMAQPYDFIQRLDLLKEGMVSKEDIIMLKKLKDDDNPVLVFYQLDSFQTNTD